MLRKIWQWLKTWFQSLFGDGRRQSSSALRRIKGDVQTPPPPPLTDTDYEFLYSQLLEGVTNGWQEARIIKFFEQLGERGKAEQWVAWIRRFGERVLAAPTPNNELAARMVQLNAQMQSIPSLRQIGEVSYDMGMQLLTRDTVEPIWEYDGLDGEPTTPEFSSEAAGVETITLDELMERLQQDENLVHLLAQQLGMETADPQLIIQALIEQFNAGNQVPVEEADLWFNQGIEQFNGGDLEAAIASWDKTLEMNPGKYEAWHNRGVALERLGRSEEANESFNKSEELRVE